MRKLPILIAALALSAPAWGQGSSNRDVCHGAMTAPDAAIAACTALLEEDRDSPVDLAKDLANRAFAQLAKGQTDLAIADATRAIRIKADYALIKADKGDRWGNLLYHGTGRNFGPIMATAALCTIAQVNEIVELGKLDPEIIVTPGIFVKRVVLVGGKS